LILGHVFKVGLEQELENFQISIKKTLLKHLMHLIVTIGKT